MSDVQGPTGIASFKVEKEVNINPLPQVHLLDSPVEVCANNSKSPKTSHPSTKEFNVFYSNISSFSLHAREYLFANSNSTHMFMLAELHKPSQFVRSKFQKQRFSVSYNFPENFDKGTHGGEVIACKNNLGGYNIPFAVTDTRLLPNAPLARPKAEAGLLKRASTPVASEYYSCSGHSVTPDGRRPLAKSAKVLSPAVPGGSQGLAKYLI